MFIFRILRMKQQFTDCTIFDHIQSGVALIVLCIYIRAGLEKHTEDSFCFSLFFCYYLTAEMILPPFTEVTGMHQRRLSVVVLCIHIRTRSNERLHNPRIALSDGTHQQRQVI